MEKEIKEGVKVEILPGIIGQNEFADRAEVLMIDGNDVIVRDEMKDTHAIKLSNIKGIL